MENTWQSISACVHPKLLTRFKSNDLMARTRGNSSISATTRHELLVLTAYSLYLKADA